MRTTTAELTAEILKLPSEEIAQVVEALLDRIDPISPEVDKIWVREAEERIDAFEQGKISAVDAESAMNRLREGLKD
ncbi:MAG TPA: addiction module protein [Chthoniobacterales bacterium]